MATRPGRDPESERSDSGQRSAAAAVVAAVSCKACTGAASCRTVRFRSPLVHPGGGQQGPTSSRLQRVEAALAAETAGREKAERALHEAQAQVQALQTKMGHNDLAKNEAMAAAKRHLDEVVTVREELAAAVERLRETEATVREAEEEISTLRSDLAEERRARKLAERLLREATEEPALALAARRNRFARPGRTGACPPWPPTSGARGA